VPRRAQRAAASPSPAGPPAGVGPPAAANPIHDYLERHFSSVFGILVRLARCICPWRDPKDVAGDVIVKLWARADQFHAGRDPWPWIRQTAVNAARDACRSVGDKPGVRVPLSGDLTSADDIEAQVLILGVIRPTIASLSDEERQALFEGFGRGRPSDMLSQILKGIVAVVRQTVASDVPFPVIARNLRFVIGEFMEMSDEKETD